MLARATKCQSRIYVHVSQHGKAFSANSSRWAIETETSNIKHIGETVQPPLTGNNAQTDHMKLKTSQRDLVIDVLGASTTKREAKSYLNRFQLTSNSDRGTSPSDESKSSSTGVNLGRLYPMARDQAVRASAQTKTKSHAEPLHIAIVLIREPELISDTVLHGITRTLSQLTQLGMQCIVVLDSRTDNTLSNDPKSRATHRRKEMYAQADRIVQDIESHPNQRARHVDYLFATEHVAARHAEGNATTAMVVKNIHLLQNSLNNETIPVVMSAYTDQDLGFRQFDSANAIGLLSRTLSRTSPKHKFLDSTITHEASSPPIANELVCLVDRIIILDHAGGIPVGDSSHNVHTFINLEQEYGAIAGRLDQRVAKESGADLRSGISSVSSHLQNLMIAQRTLRYLPSTASALITSPEAVARYEYSGSTATMSSVGTRSKKNLLVHNILTDKPIQSSSLPLSRSEIQSGSLAQNHTRLSATFLKRGMPVTIVPDPKHNPWIPPEKGVKLLSLTDPRLDIARLVHLIEDSFGRPLDQKHYFDRIAPRLCGIIIAGAYEGGAILTWEKPPSAIEGDVARYVPYLDKFAVLKRSQGSGGVADVVFSAMIRDCFPQGVCWRSRSNNPVNKWYFERATGTARLEAEDRLAQSWTMFWTTENVKGQKLRDYEEVCSSIGSSWADNKAKLD